jgi:hypothetical protein
MKTLMRGLPFGIVGYVVGIIIEILRHYQPYLMTMSTITAAMTAMIPIGLGAALLLVGMIRRE